VTLKSRGIFNDTRDQVNMADDFNFELPPEVDITLPDFSAQGPSQPTHLRQDGANGRGRTAALAGIDEEIIMKKRRPTVKLDAEKLMSDKGLPLLCREAPNGIKFKGKGHEMRDLRKLVEYYTLWAHGLYPRANFQDFLTITEKMGHTKRMQMARNEILDRTNKRDEDSELIDEPTQPPRHESNNEAEPLFFDDDEDDVADNISATKKEPVHRVSLGKENDKDVPKELQGLSDDDMDNGLFPDFE